MREELRTGAGRLRSVRRAESPSRATPVGPVSRARASTTMTTVVVIPTYNEAANVERIVTGVLQVSASLDVLVVDDASPDGTGAIADRLAAEGAGRVRVLHRERKLGLGAAYLDAYRHAVAGGYDTIVT